MFRKIILFLFFSLSSFMVLPFCNGSEEPQKTGGVEKIIVSLGWHLDPCQGPILYAMHQGTFKKHGLDITITPASGGEESSRYVAMKRAHIGITKSTNHIVRVNTGLPLKKVGTLVGSPLEVLIVPEHMTNLTELKGKTIGFSTSNVTFSLLVLDKILEKQGLKRDDITLVAFQQGLMQAFLSKQIDALFTATDPYDTKMAEQFEKPIRVYRYEAFGIPSFEQFIFFIHKDDEGKPYIRSFLLAIKESIAAIKHDPGKAWQELCDAYPELDTSLNYKIWLRLVELFETHPEALNRENLIETLTFLSESQVDGKPVIDRNRTSIDDVVCAPGSPTILSS